MGNGQSSENQNSPPADTPTQKPISKNDESPYKKPMKCENPKPEIEMKEIKLSVAVEPKLNVESENPEDPENKPPEEDGCVDKVKAVFLSSILNSIIVNE